MKTKVMFAGACLLMAAVVAACGPSEEEAYLDEVRAAWSLSRARFESFDKTFNERVWQDTGQLFEALTREGAGTAYDATFEAIEKLDPPERFADDHAHMLGGVRDLVALDKAIGQSLASENLLAFVLGNSGLYETNSLMLLGLSPDVCEATLGGESSQCARPDPIPGGEYGTELYQIAGQFAAQFGARTGAVSIPPQTRQDETLDIMATLRGQVTDIVEQTLAKMRELDPPANLQSDHDRLLGYLEEELREAQAMPIVQLNIPQSESVAPPVARFCKVKAELSPAVQSIVRFYFEHESGLCERPPQ